jgi:hypothetical protein
MLTRVTSFTPGVLPSSDLESEFNNIVNYINNRTLSSPLSANLDFADLFTIVNLRTFWNTVNVAEFSSLSAAIAALPSSGGFLFVPPNTTIDISSTVIVTKDNVWLVGAGPSSILRRATGTFSEAGDAMIFYNTRLNCGIMNLQIDGQQESNSANSGMPAVRVKGASTNFKFLNNLVRRWGGSAEAAANTNDGIVIGDDEASVPSGIHILGNTFENVRRSPVRLTNCRYGVVQGNTMTWDAISSVGAGIHLETAATGTGRLQFNVITGNVIAGIGANLPAQGIAVVSGTTTTVDVSRCAISANEISNVAGSGIHISEAMIFAITGNSLDTTNQSGTSEIGGIHAVDSAYLDIVGNVLNVIGQNIAASAANGIMLLQSTGTVHGFNRVVSNVLREIANNGISAQLTGTVSVPSLAFIGNTISRFGRTSGGAGVAAGIDVFVGNGTSLSGVQANDNIVSLDGTTPGTAITGGIRFEYSGTGTGARAQIVGNDVGDAESGGGLGYDVIGSLANHIPSVLDVGHNLT